MKFAPNTFCKIEASTGAFDRYGRQVVASSRRVACSVVRAKASGLRTSLRSDTSATQGYASETEHDALVLFKLTERIAIGDVMEIDGLKFEVKSTHVRRAVDGKLHHLEVGGDAWVSR